MKKIITLLVALQSFSFGATIFNLPGGHFTVSGLDGDEGIEIEDPDSVAGLKSGYVTLDDIVDYVSTNPSALGFELPSMDSTARDALTPTNGLVIWNTTTAQAEIYDGSWGALGSGSGGLGSSLSSTTDDITSTGGLNLNAAAGAFNILMKLGDAAGAQKFSIVDSGSVEVANFDSDGVLTLPIGSKTAPTLQFGTQGATSGIYSSNTATSPGFGLAVSGVSYIYTADSGTGFRIHKDWDFCWGSNQADDTVDTRLQRISAGQIGVGNSSATDPQAIHVFDGGIDNEPGFLVLYRDDGTPVYLWQDTAGNFRFQATTQPTDDDTDGTVVGGGAFSDSADPIVQNTTTKDVQFGDGAGTLTGKVEIGGDADQPQLVIEAHSTQTDDVLIVQNDADTEVFSVSVAGDVNAAGDINVANATATTLTFEGILDMGTWEAFTAADATPTVAGGALFESGGAITITDFDDGVEGQIIYVHSLHAVTFDVTGTDLEGGSTDLVTADGDVTQWISENGTTWKLVSFVDASANAVDLETDVWIIAASDETTALTTGTGKVKFKAPYAATITDVSASVTTAPTDATLIVDINEEGTSIMTTNKIQIETTEDTSEDATTQPGVTDTAIAQWADITIDIDQIGSTVAGAGLKVYITHTH